MLRNCRMGPKIVVLARDANFIRRCDMIAVPKTRRDAREEALPSKVDGQRCQAGAGPKMSTAFEPPNANEFYIV